MIKKCIDRIVDHYAVVIGISTIIFIFFAFQVPRVKIDNSVDNFLTEDHFLNREGRRYDKVFGPGSGIIVSVGSDRIYSVPFMQKLLSFTKEMDRLNQRIIANTSGHVRLRVREILGLDKEGGAAAFAFLSSLAEKPATVAALDSKFSEDEMMMIEDQSQVPVILNAYRGLSLENKQALLRTLSPAFVKEAISIVNADYVEGEGDKFKVEKMIDRDVADAGVLSSAAINKLRARVRRWDIYDQFLLSRRAPERITSERFDNFLRPLQESERALLKNSYIKQDEVWVLKGDAPLLKLEPVFQKVGYRRSAAVLIRLEDTSKSISEVALTYARQVIREYSQYRLYTTDASGTPLKSKNRLGESRPYRLLSKKDLSHFIQKEGIPSVSGGLWSGSVTGRDGRQYRLAAPLFPSNDNPIHVAGEPVVTTMLGTTMVKDLKLLIPFVILVVMISLLVAFRQFGPMIVPLIGVLYATVMVVGLMGMMGVSLTVISVVLPVLMVAVGSAYGIHVVNHFQVHPHPELKEAVRRSLKSVLTPVAMAAFTTVGGFMALITNGVVPVRNFGLFTGVGVFFSFVISVTLVPALLIAFRVRREEPDAEGDIRHNRFLAAISRVAIRKHKTVLISGAILLIVSAVAVVGLRVDTNGIQMFKTSSEIRIADAHLNANFRGTSIAELVIRTDGLNSGLTPRILKMVDGLEGYLKKDPEIGQYVGGVLSVADYIKKANSAMHGEKAGYYRIPDTQAAVLDFMLILKKDTDNVCSPEGDRLKVLLTMRTGSTSVARKLRRVLGAYFTRFDTAYSIKGKVPSGTFQIRSKNQEALVRAKQGMEAYFRKGGKEAPIMRLTAGTLAVSAKEDSTLINGRLPEVIQGAFITRPLYLGMLMKYLEVDSLVVMGQVLSMLLSLLVVFLLNSIVFRSVIEAGISLVPLVITILLNFAVMSVFGILLDVATSMIASVAIGIGIDYTIHFLSGFKSRYLAGEGLESSLSDTGMVTGRAILYNATAVLFGFAVLPFSSFIPLINFGALTALTMFTTAMASLTMIPAILIQIRRMPFFNRIMEKEKAQFERAAQVVSSGGRRRSRS